MPKTFPFRKPVAEVSNIQILGGNRKVRFTKMKMADGDKHPLYVNRKEFQEKISILDAKVRASIEGKSIKEVTAYTKSAERSIALFTLELLNRIGETGNNIDLENKHIFLGSYQQRSLGDVYDQRRPSQQ